MVLSWAVPGCVHEKTPAEEMRSAEKLAQKATDADVRDTVKRLLDAPPGTTFFDPSWGQLTLLSGHHGPRIVEEVLRQGTARRTEHNSDDDPTMFVLSLLRIGMVTWDDTLEVATDLMKSEDPHLKEVAQELVRYLLEFHDVFGGMPDDMVSFLTTHSQDQNQELIQLMLDTCPEFALLVMSDSKLMQGEEGRNFQWAGHLIEEVAWRERNHFADRIPADQQAAVEQLRFLAARPEWWARYYAAEMTGSCEALADPATKERLKTDPDRRVREVIDPPRRIESPEPEPEPPHYPVIGGGKR
jgi:hypothetical protein